MVPASPEPVVDIDHLRQWVGSIERLTARLDPFPAAGMHALLDLDGPPPGAGADLPPAWHWLFFHQPARQSALGLDGHPARGGFLPPVPLPRRMWAGGRLRFDRPLLVDAEAQRESDVLSVDAKQGRSGRLVFVTVRHRLSQEGSLCIEEEHDIVYRDPPPADTSGKAAGGPATAAPSGPAARTGEPNATWRRRVHADAVMLFRYSALTFNGHRIHYDQPYATGVEGYPGLIVHGPLMATLMLELLRAERPDRPVRRFAFRGLAPAFDTHPIEVCGRPADGSEPTAHTWVEGPGGTICMRGTAEFAA